MSGEGTLVVARVWDEPGAVLPGRIQGPRGRPQGSPPLIPTTPAPTEGLSPLRFSHPLSIRLMRMRADQSAVGAINRPPQ
jgi:hypothetical protein